MHSHAADLLYLLSHASMTPNWYNAIANTQSGRKGVQGAFIIYIDFRKAFLLGELQYPFRKAIASMNLDRYS